MSRLYRPCDISMFCKFLLQEFFIILSIYVIHRTSFRPPPSLNLLIVVNSSDSIFSSFVLLLLSSFRLLHTLSLAILSNVFSQSTNAVYTFYSCFGFFILSISSWPKSSLYLFQCWLNHWLKLSSTRVYLCSNRIPQGYLCCKLV